jgi:hypothetical protein
VTSKTEGKVDNSHMLVKYDARLRDNAAHGVVQEVTDTVQVGLGHAGKGGGQLWHGSGTSCSGGREAGGDRERCDLRDCGRQGE